MRRNDLLFAEEETSLPGTLNYSAPENFRKLNANGKVKEDDDDNDSDSDDGGAGATVR